MNYNFIGIDVSKDKFDVAIKKEHGYENMVFSRNEAGFKKFISYLEKNVESPWCCMEATGHYSEEIAEYLVKKHVHCSIINPMQIKNFARSKLLRNKNDIVDARIIADFALANPPRKFEARSKSQNELRGLTKLLSTLKSHLVQLKNKQHSMQGEIAKQYLIESIAQLEQKIKNIEKELDKVVKSDPQMNEQFNLITSIPGIGNIISYSVLERIPDIKLFTHAKQFAAFTGVSPKQNQSGKWAGRTTISKIGDRRLRAVLYMGALVAKQHNPALKSFTQALASRGKSPKAIVCAVMRKLAHFIFAVLNNKKAFDVNFGKEAICY